jgi:Fe-Mn family superoxide dismutase
MKRTEIPPTGARWPRRTVLKAAAALAGVAALDHAAGAVEATRGPAETGLSYEGLLKNEPGFQPRRPAPLPFASLPGLLSARQTNAIDAAYRAAFARLLETERGLAAAARDAAHAAEYARLRGRQIESANAVLLYEFFLRNLAPAPVAPPRYVMANIHEHMGSFASWREDFIACARVAEAWAALSYDPYDDRWHNAPLSAAAAGGWVGGNPLVVAAVAEHAWSLDYPNREAWAAAFVAHIDWNVVAARYRVVDRH